MSPTSPDSPRSLDGVPVHQPGASPRPMVLTSLIFGLLHNVSGSGAETIGERLLYIASATDYAVWIVLITAAMSLAGPLILGRSLSGAAQPTPEGHNAVANQ